MTVTAADLIVRVSNDEVHRRQANTWATLAEIDGIAKFRVDVALWAARTEDERVRLAVTAYEDIGRLSWSCFHGRSQSRDYGWVDLYGDPVGCSPLVNNPDFIYSVKKAQVAQIMFLIAGTQVRDMAREGIMMTRMLTGSEIEFSGYRGACGAETMEILSNWIEISPRLTRFA